MTSPAVLDFDRLIQPISESSPAGTALKGDPKLGSVYDSTREAAMAARGAEKDAVKYKMLSPEDREKTKQPDAPNWKRVVELATAALAQHTKDLWICAWLVEGLCRTNGFAGLRDGFRLTRELSERFWDGIFPRPDEDGLATTVAQFAGLNGEDREGVLIPAIEAILLTEGNSEGPFSGFDYRAATSGSDSERAYRIKQGGATIEMIQKAATETSAEFASQLLEEIEGAVDEFGKLVELFDQKCGSASPPSTQIRTALTDARDRVQSLYKTQSGEVATSVGTASAGRAAPAGATVATSGKVASREEAFRLLLQVADFFRRTEPHSPVSYALEQAVRWGRMSLPDLLSDLISDSGVRDEMFRRAGIPKPAEKE